MKKLKKFESFINDDEDDFDIESIYNQKLSAFYDLLNAVKSIDDAKNLQIKANEFEDENNLRIIEGPWEDFKIYLKRKISEYSPNGIVDDISFETEELKNLLDRLKIIKTKEEVDELVEEVKIYQQTINDQESYDEFQRFVKVFNDAAYNITKK